MRNRYCFDILRATIQCILVLYCISCQDENSQSNCQSIGIEAADPYENPIWHPGGELIGFNHTPLRERVVHKTAGCPLVTYSYDNDSAGFWLINSNGEGKRRILPYYLLSPAWSPDGNWIIYFKNFQIYKAPFDGSMVDIDSEIQLTFQGNNFFPAWSRDGLWIAFDSNYDSQTGLNFIWTMKQDGSEKTRIAFTPTLGETRRPSWGPSKIVHLRYIEKTQPEVFLMDKDGSNAVQLTENDSFEWQPSYSPTADNIAFVGKSTTSGRTSIWFCNPSNKELHEFLVDVADFSWSPNGKIVYVKHWSNKIDNEYGTIWTINPDGSNNIQLTNNRFIDREVP